MWTSCSRKLKLDKISWSYHTWEGNVTELPWLSIPTWLWLLAFQYKGSQLMGSQLPSQGSIMLMMWDCVWWRAKYWLPSSALCFILVTQNHMLGTNVSREPSSIFFHPDLSVNEIPFPVAHMASAYSLSHLPILCHSGFPFYSISLGDICWFLFLWFPHLNCDGMISFKLLEICAYT